MAANGRTPVIIGNWKMYKTVAEALELVRGLRDALPGLSGVEVGVAPPFTALGSVVEAVRGSSLIVAAQNCHYESAGAFTGEVSPAMVKDIGCSHVILGHSERRQYFNESDELINRKLKAALAAGLVPVLCIGESLAEREAGRTFEVVSRQLKGALSGLSAAALGSLIVAYEPVWAIGTGKTATTEQAQEVHAFLRGLLRETHDGTLAERVRIQYGGSVKPDNAAALMAQPDIDGALVGGASLKVDSFLGILQGARSA